MTPTITPAPTRPAVADIRSAAATARAEIDRLRGGLAEAQAELGLAAERARRARTDVALGVQADRNAELTRHAAAGEAVQELERQIAEQEQLLADLERREMESRAAALEAQAAQLRHDLREKVRQLGELTGRALDVAGSLDALRVTDTAIAHARANLGAAPPDGSWRSLKQWPDALDPTADDLERLVGMYSRATAAFRDD